MNELELLAPAGNLEIFKSVIDNGADAVYFGGDLYSARAYANNFSKEDASIALDYAHIRGKKAYLTVNTLLKNKEFSKDFYDFIKFYYEAGLDGVIIQDFGVFNFIKKNFPEIELHASTQMTLNTRYGAEFLKEAGASRIVTSRELSLEEIKKIKDSTGIEIEAFVHGALCMSYSGQCLMSSIIGGRSGNRGRCAQPCRLPYDIYDNNKQINNKGKYQLSPKDLCGIYDLKAMADAGVSSFKIEGRMKQIDYASTVVAIYRKYLDLLIKEGKYEVDKSDYEILLNAGNRCGFTNTYFYKHNDPDMITYRSPAHEKKEVKFFYNSASKIKIKGSFYGNIDEAITLTISYGNTYVTCKGPIAMQAKNRPLSKDDIYSKLNKTGDTDFVFQYIDIDIPDNFFIPIKEINELRRTCLEELKNKLIIRRNVSDLVCEDINHFNNIKNNNQIIPYILVNSLEQLRAVNKVNFKYKIIANYELLDDLKFEDISNLYISMPEIIRDNADYFENYKDCFNNCRGILVNSFDQLQYFKEEGISKDKLILNHRIYTYSNYSIKSYEDYGYRKFVAPLELNANEFKHRDNSNSILTIYGYYPLMVMANCLYKNNIGCLHNENKELKLIDRKHSSFIVRNHCKLCYNLIYNNRPTILFKEREAIKDLGFESYLIEFTIEDYNQTLKILELYNKSFNIKENIEIDFEYTNGHFKRGVE